MTQINPMTMPLPQDVREVLEAEQGRVDNLFLLFYRYVWAWWKNGANWSLKDGVPGKQSRRRTGFLDEVAEQTGRRASESARGCVGFQFARQQHMLGALGRSGFAVHTLERVTEGRLVAGLGYKGALEVGITLHPLYGFPYLPGTSVKGVARAYAEDVASASTDDILAVFGSRPKDEHEVEDHRLGGVRFFDALPPEFPKLDVDVMTPHYGEYYDDPGRNAPGSWLGPVPVKFLTVAPGTRFRFAVAAREKRLLDLAAVWLASGLEDLGIGGKTSAGYGYFYDPAQRPGEAEELEAVEEAMQETVSPADPAEEAPLQNVGRRTTNISARIVRREGRQLFVRLHAVGYENEDVPMIGRFNPDGFSDGMWVKVEVEEFPQRKKRVTKVRYLHGIR